MAAMVSLLLFRFEDFVPFSQHHESSHQSALTTVFAQYSVTVTNSQHGTAPVGTHSALASASQHGSAPIQQ
jgi:hypothetical protein